MLSKRGVTVYLMRLHDFYATFETCNSPCGGHLPWVDSRRLAGVEELKRAAPQALFPRVRRSSTVLLYFPAVLL